MKRRYLLLLPAVLAAAATLHGVIPPMPLPVPGMPVEARPIRITEARPGEVLPGDFATAYGFNLEAGRVKELWLVDGAFTFRVEILEQNAYSILFRVPTSIPVGRWQLAVPTDHGMMIEQGVYLRVLPWRSAPTG